MKTKKVLNICMVIKAFILIIVGLAGGLAVGGGFVAFLTVLGIIPRLTQLSKTGLMLTYYEWAVILGVLVVGWAGLQDYSFQFFHFIIIPIGLFCGVFIGMLAAALTEVLNVIPILAKRIGMERGLLTLLMAIVLGKILGSLFHWIYFINV